MKEIDESRKDSVSEEVTGAVAMGGAGLKFIPSAEASYLVPQTPLAGKSIPKYVETMPVFAGKRVDRIYPAQCLCRPGWFLLPEGWF